MIGEENTEQAGASSDWGEPSGASSSWAGTEEYDPALSDPNFEPVPPLPLNTFPPGAPGDLPPAGGGAGRAPPTSQTTLKTPGMAPMAAYFAQGAATARYLEALEPVFEARYKGFGIQSNIKADFAGRLDVERAKVYEDLDKLAKETETQLYAVQELMDAARSNRINPGQFFSNIGQAGRFSAVVAAAAGHLSSAMGGGPNTALQIINQAIDRNVLAQQLNMANDQAAVTNQFAFVDKLTALGISKLNAFNVHQAALTAIAQAQIDSIIAATSSEEARAAKPILEAQLNMKAIEGLVKAYQDIIATTTIRYNNMKKASSAGGMAAEANKAALASYIGQAPQGAQPAPQPGTQVQPTMPGPPASVPRRPREMRPETQISAKEPEVATLPSIELTENEKSAKLTEPDVQAANAIRDFREQRAAQGNYKIPTTAELKKFIDQYPPEVAGRMRKFETTAFKARHAEMDDYHAQLWTPQGPKDVIFVKKPAYRAIENKKEGEEVRRAVGQNLLIDGMLEQMDQIIARLGRSKGTFFAKGGGIRARFAGASQQDVEDLKTFSILAINIANLERTKLGSDAIRSVSEWEVWKDIKGVPSSGDNYMELYNVLRGWSPQQIADFARTEFKPAIRTHRTFLGAQLNTYFYTDPNELYKSLPATPGIEVDRSMK